MLQLYTYTYIHAEYILTQRIKTSDTVLRKIYLSLYLRGSKGFYCERELETEQRLQHIYRSLSSGTSVYECTMGFLPCPIFQSSPPTRFPLITAIGMCHFLPVHHFGMACLAGSKVNIRQSSLNHFSKFHMWNFFTFVSITLMHILQNNLLGQ